MVGSVSERVRELIRQICKSNEIEILKGHVSKDHIHLLVSVPPQLSVSKVVQYLKGKTSIKLLQEYKHLQKEFWGRHVWARGYFAASSGNITDEMIMEYINKQDMPSSKDDDFRVSDWAVLSRLSGESNLPALAGSNLINLKYNQ